MNQTDPTLSFLESEFPALEVSVVASGDSRSRDPSYLVHRWWARRPPSLMRAVLLAASMNGGTTNRQFWHRYKTDERVLAGLRVHDPFMGGGTTLIEAARLGAAVSGTDIDPTAHLMVAHSLEPPSLSEIEDVGSELLCFLREHFSVLYPNTDGEPLHWFWIAIVKCPYCSKSGPLYRSLVLARDCSKSGAVVRDHGTTVFDPETFDLYYLSSPTETRFQGSNREWNIDQSTFQAFKYECQECRRKLSHRELQTGSAPLRLVAVERTPIGLRRKLFKPSVTDHNAVGLACELLKDPPVPLRFPEVDFEQSRHDPRPRSYGICAVRDLFTPRQLLVLGAANAWIDTLKTRRSTIRALRLILSNVLLTNNRLCSYATDYGRLSPLFSIRSYSIPTLQVELNPLHSSGGRGTIQQCLNRVLNYNTTSLCRSTWDPDIRQKTKRAFDLTIKTPEIDIKCLSAAENLIKKPIDLLLFDPPYYDYIIYDELAEIFRAWNPNLQMNGDTLQSTSNRKPDDFGRKLADCLRPSLKVRNPRLPIAFTFHSSKHEAWEAIGIALDTLSLSVTAIWPVRSDEHMGPHSSPGNCEWDLVIVCRPSKDTRRVSIPKIEKLLMQHTGAFRVGNADLASFSLAYEMAALRYGKLNTSFSEQLQSGGSHGFE